MTEWPTIETLRLVGEHPALDFVNTVSEQPDGATRDHLADYAALLAWSRRLGLITASQVGAMKRRAGARPELAARCLADAHALRASIYDLFAATATGAPRPRAALTRFNNHLHTAQAHAE